MPKKTEKKEIIKTKTILKSPRVTEKASNVIEHNVYTFNVATNTTKNEIKKEIFATYKVKPVKVNIVNIKPKNVISRTGLKGVKQGGKKAMIYLKKGDKIEL